MISEGPSIEEWSNDAENSALNHKINILLKLYKCILK